MLKSCRGMKNQLSHVWHWKEHTDGSDLTTSSYNALMLEAGKLAEKLDEDIAGVKGMLQVRAKRAGKQ